MKEYNLNRLTEPFDLEDLEFRLAQCGKTNKGDFWGKCLTYITSRAVFDRLDEVFGSMNWKISHVKASNGVMCTISVYDQDKKEWVSKEDGAENTDIEEFKGGISSAVKRAAVPWGIGRYLYKLEESWIGIVPHGTKGAFMGQTKDKERFFWLPPSMPSWALPKDSLKSDNKRGVGVVVSPKPSSSTLSYPVDCDKNAWVNFLKVNNIPMHKFQEEMYSLTGSDKFQDWRYEALVSGVEECTK